MNIALGVTYADCASHRAIVTASDDLALVTAPSAKADTARARLAQQVAWARDLPSFLPFQPKQTVEVADALSRVTASAHVLRAQLNACLSLVQLTILLTVSSAAERHASQSWLRHRADETQRRSAASACIVSRLREIGPSSIWYDVKRGLVHLTGERVIGHRVHMALGNDDWRDGARALHGCSVTVTGPWPVFAELDGGVLK